MANIKNRVLQELGQDNSDYLDEVSNHANVFTKAYWEALKLLPPRMLISNVPQPINLEKVIEPNDAAPQYITIDDATELLVNRVEADHVMNEAGDEIVTTKFISRACKRISLENSRKALDPDSIYFATAHSPVYWYEATDSSGAQKIATAPAATGYVNTTNTNQWLPKGYSGIEVYLLRRYTFSDNDVSLTNGNALESFPLIDSNNNTTTGDLTLPEMFEGFVIKKIAHAFLIEKIAHAAVQDEDSELLTILTTQSQIMSELLGKEVEEMTERWGINE